MTRNDNASSKQTSEMTEFPFEFILYVSGDSEASEFTVCNLRNLCAQQFHGKFLLTVVDVNRNPELAEEQNILATPTLVQVRPAPVRRILGDLNNRGRLLGGLGLSAESPFTP